MELLRRGILRWIPVTSFIGGFLGMFWEIVAVPILSSRGMLEHQPIATDAVQICGAMMAAFPLLQNMVDKLLAKSAAPPAAPPPLPPHPPEPKALPGHVAPNNPEAV